MTLFVDTGFYQALLYKHDEHHAEAVGISRTLDQRLTTTEWVLAKLLNGFSRGPRNRRNAIALVEALRTDPRVLIIPATHADFARGMALYGARPDKNWSLVDCISFQVMADRRLTHALTFDDHFEQAGFGRIG